MPMLKRQLFVPLKPPADLRPDEEVFYLKLTNEIFRDYDEYFERMILCNSLVWSCSLTGKANLTFQEALDSEKQAKKQLKGFPKELKKALFYLVTLTNRAKVLDVYEDVYAYARERYFKNETVLSVIGNMWCPSRVTRIIYPTKEEIEAYRHEQIEKGEFEKNDYLKDDSWGPPPDLFRYEVQETDPSLHEVYILEAIDVKREKTLFTRDKCKYVLKLATEYSEEYRCWRVREDVAKSLGLASCRFEDIFIGPSPKFEPSPAPAPRVSVSAQANKSSKQSSPSRGKVPADGENKKKNASEPKPKIRKDGQQPEGKKKPRSKSLEPGSAKKSNKTTGQERKSGPVQANAIKERKKPGPKPKKDKVVEEKKVELTPQELKQIELERRAKEREKLRKEKKLIADFKKLWFKPKEDLEVEDLKDLPVPDPVQFKIPNHLFGDFVAVLEFFNCYSNMLKVRDCFSSGLGFDALETALCKNEVAGPLSDILQLLLRSIFRLQEAEHSEISHDQAAAVELDVDEIGGDTAKEAIEQATTAATWSTMYQNTPLHKLTLDHLSLSEVLRLHLLTSGARPSEKDVKFRWQNRGCYDSYDDPGLRLRLDEPQILKTLSHGSVFDLTIAEKLKVIMCLINQMLTFFDVRETMEDSFEQFKQNRITLRSLQAAEKRKETEDNLWKTRLRTDKVVPDPNSLKAPVEKDKEKNKEGSEDKDKEKPPSTKPPLTDEQIEALIEKRDKETAKRKQEIMWKEAELLDAINKHERKLGIHPVGRDRAFRRYWIFNTIAGIFVEHDDEFVGSCLPSPTPYLPDVNLNDFNFVKENFDKIKTIDKEGSDKENSTLATPKKSPKKKQASSKSRDAPPRPEIFGVCTGDPKACPVHCANEALPKWSFYWSPEQLDGLLEGLTPRGIREKELKQTLSDEKEGLINLLKRCPVNKLNRENEYPEYMLSIAERKAQRQGSTKHLNPNLNYPPGTPVEKILELQLRDLILETEEKIFLGTLGSLKVSDRDKWRKAIEDRTYDLQTEDLLWGQTKSLKKERLKKEAAQHKLSLDHNDDGSSTSGSSVGEARPVAESFPVNPHVKDLACAVLQLCQSVEPKFFKKPLGIGKDEGKTKSKSSGHESKAADLIKSQSLSTLERWESSLMASTSFSQIFMHLFTLDNSIEWSRSVLNARCRICRRKGDSDNMLLCDECNRGHHAYCLKPALQVIPKGDWYCSECRPPEPPPKINRRQRTQALNDDELNELLGSDDEDDDFSRDSPRKKQNGPRDLQSGDDEAEVCEVCGFGGQVICCDKCPRLYHLMCLDPPKTRVPRGTWYCPVCSNSSSSSSSKKGQKKASHQKSSRGSKRKATKNSSSSSGDDSDSESKEDSQEYSEQESEDEDVEGEEDNGLVNGYVEDGNDDDDEDGEETGDSDDEDVEKPKMKVKIGAPSTSRAQKNSTYGTRSSGGASSSASGRNRKYILYSDEEDSEAEHLGRGSKRKSASQAAVRIAQVAKRLRSDSKENESSENSNDSTQSQQQQRKRSYDSEGGSGASVTAGSDCPKRTRLQRMNTNQCGQNGELDNVLLDRLLADVMKHGDAWPFLKPVSRVEAPDYLQVVIHPMDLGTIKYKLNSMVYTCNEELISDLMLVFSNCMQYNESSHPIYKAGENLKRYCLYRLSKLGIHLSEPSSASGGN
ncbi:unnamed protein product [Allacma fusca]|uniref:Bromodomain adjacent to zinc finger domain protein 1A n=1 Tax=Allacma fusca TaxID=39272 RepID=A0A8J2LSS1_9HEXA|nr:unnamed protein product [Allacma fusca]